MGRNYDVGLVMVNPCECCGSSKVDVMPFLLDENAEVYLCAKCALDLKDHVTVEPIDV